MTRHHLAADLSGCPVACVGNLGSDDSSAAQRRGDRLIAAFAPQPVQRRRWLRGEAFVSRASHAAN
jgi:hypothetical protein